MSFLWKSFKVPGVFDMKFGSDFFKIFGFAIQLIRLFVGVFGDNEDKKGVAESKDRSANDNPDEAC